MLQCVSQLDTCETECVCGGGWWREGTALQVDRKFGGDGPLPSPAGRHSVLVGIRVCVEEEVWRIVCRRKRRRWLVHDSCSFGVGHHKACFISSVLQEQEKISYDITYSE